MIKGIVVLLFGIVLLVGGLLAVLYACVFEYCDSTMEAMAIALLKKLAGFCGLLMLFFGFFVFLAGCLQVASCFH